MSPSRWTTEWKIRKISGLCLKAENGVVYERVVLLILGVSGTRTKLLQSTMGKLEI